MTGEVHLKPFGKTGIHVSALGLGRDTRIWTILEIINLLMILIFPIKLRFLSCQIVQSLLIFINFYFEFSSVISFSSIMS